jgi:hypothetical protein
MLLDNIDCRRLASHTPTLRRANPSHQGRKTPAWGPLTLASAGLVA